MAHQQLTQKLRVYSGLPGAFQASFRAFQSSSEKFKVLKTVRSSDPYVPIEPIIPAVEEQPRSLFILDSSFNPPSIAHQTLAVSALSATDNAAYPTPRRLLLLFATMNADKAPSAASFDQRLTLMTIFAGDVLTALLAQDSHNTKLSIDIGVTKVPFYTDKSQAIEADGRHVYSDQPKHIHIVGFDTLTRIFAAKYYSSFDPPFSALEPYFDQGGHRFRVTLRPDQKYGDVAEQHAFAAKLEAGEMEHDGAKRIWAQQIDLVQPNAKDGVSSTSIRDAAKLGQWDKVSDLCTPSIPEWIRHEALYEEDDTGVKMA